MSKQLNEAEAPPYKSPNASVALSRSNQFKADSNQFKTDTNQFKADAKQFKADTQISTNKDKKKIAIKQRSPNVLAPNRLPDRLNERHREQISIQANNRGKPGKPFINSSFSHHNQPDLYNVNYSDDTGDSSESSEMVEKPGNQAVGPHPSRQAFFQNKENNLKGKPYQLTDKYYLKEAFSPQIAEFDPIRIQDERAE